LLLIVQRKKSEEPVLEQLKRRKILMDKAREHQQPLYMCFVDFKKAFDSISHDKLCVTMMDMRYPLCVRILTIETYDVAPDVPAAIGVSDVGKTGLWINHDDVLSVDLESLVQSRDQEIKVSVSKVSLSRQSPKFDSDSGTTLSVVSQYHFVKHLL